jgi:iron complex outermembrane receptor protein
LGSHLLIAQSNSVTLRGKITESGTQEGLQGVSVFLHETKQGIATQTDGTFILSNIRKGTYHLHVQLLGYEIFTKTITLHQDTAIEVILKPTLLELHQIVIEDDFLRTDKKESSLSIERLDRNSLERHYDNTLMNTLEKLPGVSAIHTGVGISKPVIRGMSLNRVVVNEQGIKQEGQQWGTDHGLEIDQYNVDRIEIVKGAVSLLYGSDGIAGAINILPPPIPAENTAKATFTTFYRSNNEAYGFSAQAQTNVAKKFLQVRYTHQSFGDYKVPADRFLYNNFILPIYNNRLKNTGGVENHFSVAGGTTQSWGTWRIGISSFQQKAGLFPGAVGIPRAYMLTNDGNKRNIELPHQDIQHLKVIGNANIAIGKGWLEIETGLQQNQRFEKSRPHAHGRGPTPEGNLAHGLRLRTASFNMRYYFNQTEKKQWIVGTSGQWQQNQRSGFEFLLPDFTATQAGIFAFHQVKISPKWTANAGLRFNYGTANVKEWTDTDYSDPQTIAGYWLRSQGFYQSFANWSGAAGLSFNPDEDWNIKFNVGRAFRIPQPSELTLNGVHHGTFRFEQGNRQLRNEIGIMTDLGLHFEQKNRSFHLTPYFNWFENYLFLRPQPTFLARVPYRNLNNMVKDSVLLLPDAGQVYAYEQTNAIHMGFEAAADYHFLKDWHTGISAEYVWNYNLQTGLPLPFTPPFCIAAETDYTIEKIGHVWRNTFFGVEYRYYAAQMRVDRNEMSTPAYELIHFSMGTSCQIKNQIFQLFFRVNNIADTKYLNHMSRYRLLNLPEQGRNYMITLKVPIGIWKAS